MPPDPRHVFWLRTRRLTGAMLVLWLLLNLLVPWFARELNTVQWMGFPLGFWLAAQGSLLIFLLLIAIHVWCMERLESAYLENIQAPPPAVPPAP